MNPSDAPPLTRRREDATHEDDDDDDKKPPMPPPMPMPMPMLGVFNPPKCQFFHFIFLAWFLCTSRFLLLEAATLFTKEDCFRSETSCRKDVRPPE
jgi:hypothetical protein